MSRPIDRSVERTSLLGSRVNTMDFATPVVLVHGSWHSSWCWSLVTEHLAGLGVPAVAVDMDGHGLKGPSPRSRWQRPFDPAAYAAEPSPVATVTASSAAATLIGQLRRIGNGRPCVLVAHSMGGVVATAVAEQAPELVSEVVYLSAFAPVSGKPTSYYFTLPEASPAVLDLLVGDFAQTGALRVDTGDPERHDAIRDAFYNDVDDTTAVAAISMLTSDGPLGIPGETLTVTGERYGTVQHTFVVCLRDNAFPVALQRRFIAEIDAVSAKPTTVLEIDSSHSPFLSRPAELARIIAAVHGGGHPNPAEPMGIMDTRLVHDVHRTATSLLAESAARESVDAGLVTELRDFLVGALRHHHESEDHILWPRLAGAAPDAARRLASLSDEHDALDAALETLAAAPVHGERAQLVAAAEAVRDLVHQHMEHEEPILFPVLRDHMPDEEWTAYSKEIIASTPPTGGHLMIGFLDEVGTPDEVAALLVNLPEPVRPMVEDMRRLARANLAGLREATA
jgi:pimeloyl-ACP methyl ester carboxylesterase/hemerythrin-like domain-containing protein